MTRSHFFYMTMAALLLAIAPACSSDSGGGTGPLAPGLGGTGQDTQGSGRMGDTSLPGGALDALSNLDTSRPSRTDYGLPGTFDPGMQADLSQPTDTGGTGFDFGGMIDGGLPVDVGGFLDSLPSMDGLGSGACTNPADLAALQSADIATTISDCAMSCIMGGGDTCAKDCVIEKTGLSDACAQCFGDIISCATSKCMFQCMGGDTPECASCRETSCNPAFEECAGVSANQ